MKYRLDHVRKIGAALAVLLLLAGVISSCRKYLSPSPLSTIDPSITFGNVPNARAALMGAYLSMSGDFGYGIRASYYYPHDDDAIMGGGAGLDQPRHQEAHYTIQAGNSDIVNTFNQFYQGIEKANNCIAYIPNMPGYGSNTADGIELRRMHGEALVVRAQYYFELVRIWGDVPAHWVPSAFIPDFFEKRMDRDSIYDHLLSDLALAKTLMPWRTAVVGAADERFTKGSAMALRAKIALFAGGYSLRQDGQMKRPANYLDFYKIARAECDTLMQNRNQHTLLPSYKSLWKDNIDAHKPIDPAGEIIMQVAMANGTNSDSKLGLQNGTKINGVGGALGIVLPTYFYQFDSTDVRRDVTVVPFEVFYDVYGKGHASNSIYDGKFRRDWVSNQSFYFSVGPSQPTLTTTPASNASLQNMQLNWPLIRFADVLLMFAEADNEINGTPTAAAVAAWREVSTRGHGGNANLVPTPPGDKDGFFKLLVRERHLEFGGEGIRKYDLVRWNLLGKALTETKANLVNFSAGTAMNAPTYMAAPPAYTLTANLPKQMYYYGRALADDGKIWANSFYNPTPATAPLDITVLPNVVLTSANRVNWFANTNVNTSYVPYYANGFIFNHSELYPIPQGSIDANPNLRPQNPGY